MPGCNTREENAAELAAEEDRRASTVLPRDVGIAIHDFFEGETFCVFRDVPGGADGPGIEDSGEEAHAEVIDASDPTNLIVMLDNGQRFNVRITAEAPLTPRSR